VRKHSPFNPSNCIAPGNHRDCPRAARKLKARKLKAQRAANRSRQRNRP
jgi:hypothetical protein